MRILIADDQKIIQIGLEKIFESEQEIEIVGVADNGQEAIEKTERLLPDLVLMDMEMPIMNGIIATREITSKFPKVKVIILTASVQPLFSKAISAGARGLLLKGTSKEDFLAALSSVARGNILYLGQNLPKPQKLTELKSSTSFGDRRLLKELASPFKVQTMHLKSWSNLLAAEIINYWLFERKIELDSEPEVLSLLGIKTDSTESLINFLKQGGISNCSLIEELNLRLNNSSLENNKIIKKEELESNLIDLENKLTHWYNGNSVKDGYICCLIKLQFNSQALRIKLSETLKQLINSFWSKTSPNYCLEYLEKLETLFKNIDREYLKKKETCLLEEKAGLSAYDYLKQQIKKNNNLKRNREDYLIAIKALSHIYKSKINAEIYYLASQALKNNIQLIQLYIDNLIQTNYFLEKIKKEFITQQTNKIILPFIFEQMSQFTNLEKLCKEMEEELGHSLNQWGICSYITEEKVKNILSKKTDEIIFKINQKINEELSQQYFIN